MKAINDRQNFFVVTPFRIILCLALCGFFAVFCALGPALWRFYFGEGNTYVYSKGNLGVHFVDVGHGDCTIVQLPDGKVAVIDTGAEMYYPRVKTYLQQRIKPKKKRIDYLIISHPHEDHMGGLAKMTKDFRVGKIIDHENMAEGDIIAGIIQFHAVGIHEGGDENECSPIITIKYAHQIFVITGDAGHTTETAFMETPTAKELFGGDRAQETTVWLQIGHHGSRNSTGGDFLEFLRPDYGIISLGTLYNHPHDEVINWLDHYGVKTLMTRDQGHIAVRCSGDTAKIFFAFRNPIDLTWVWLVIFVGTVFLCFVNQKIIKKPQIVHEKHLTHNI